MKEQQQTPRTLLERAVRCIDAALDDGMLGSHAAHWDRTGGGGSGCPACKANAEARQKLYEARAALSCVETRRFAGALDAAKDTSKHLRLLRVAEAARTWRHMMDEDPTGIHALWARNRLDQAFAALDAIDAA